MKIKKLCLTLIASSFFSIPMAYGMEDDTQRQVVQVKPKIEGRLEELKIKLPTPAKTATSFVPFKIIDNMVYISGQLPVCDGTLLYKGKLGREFKIHEGQKAAKLCTYNILAYLKEACDGDLDRVQECVRLGVWVNSTDDFEDQPKVANAATDLINAIFGENGLHVRAAVGSNSLPFRAAVEIDAIFVLKKMSKL